MRKVLLVGKSHGTSMEPFIPAGTKLYIQKADKADIGIGDIVVFFQKGKMLGHRVLLKKKKHIFTKGDNSPGMDYPVSYKNILGKVVYFQTRTGKKTITSFSARLFNYFWVLRSIGSAFLTFILRKLSGLAKKTLWSSPS